MDDRKPLEYKAFVEFIYGKLVGDKGYISKNPFQCLFVDGIQLITKLKNNMKGALMSVSDKLLLRKRAMNARINNYMNKSKPQILLYKKNSAIVSGVFPGF